MKRTPEAIADSNHALVIGTRMLICVEPGKHSCRAKKVWKSYKIGLMEPQRLPNVGQAPSTFMNKQELVQI